MTLTEQEIVDLMGKQELARIVYTEDEIARRVGELGRSLAGYYADTDDLLVLGLLKGSFVFLADLVRQIPCPLQIDFLVASSYGTARTSSGEVEIRYDPPASLEGRDVLLVEDIVDSGHTINQVVPPLRAQGPASLEMCTLLHKRIAGDLVLEPRWVGFNAPREYLVGYGLDDAEDLRHLPFIGSLSSE